MNSNGKPTADRGSANTSAGGSRSNSQGQLRSGNGGRVRREFSGPKLSKEERGRLLADNKCFRCKEAGHTQRHCPLGNTKASQNGKPPGVSMHGVNFEEIEQLRERAEATLEVSGIEFEVDSVDDVHADLPMRWDMMPEVHRRPNIGDFAAERAMAILEHMAPYPGDDAYPLGEGEQRFWVYQDHRGHHTIFDSEFPVSRNFSICSQDIHNPKFNIAEWYATRCIRNLKDQDGWALHLPSGNRWKDGPPIGDFIAMGVRATLREGVREFLQFERGVQDKDWDVVREGDMVRIVGTTFHLSVEIERENLMEPAFDLIGWYRMAMWEQHGHRQSQDAVACWDGCQSCLGQGIEVPERSPHLLVNFRIAAAQNMLNECAPYPGDPEWIDKMPHRFKIVEESMNGQKMYRVWDELFGVASAMPLYCVDYLRNDHSPAEWYARHRAGTVGDGGPLAWSANARSFEEYVHEWMCEQLRLGAPYSSDHLWDRSEYSERFTIEVKEDDVSRTQVWIVDKRRFENREHLRVPFDMEQLDFPLFDLRDWYAGIIYAKDAEEHEDDTCCGALDQESGSSGYSSGGDPGDSDPHREWQGFTEPRGFCKGFLRGRGRGSMSETLSDPSPFAGVWVSQPLLLSKARSHATSHILCKR